MAYRFLSAYFLPFFIAPVCIAENLVTINQMPEMIGIDDRQDGGGYYHEVDPQLWSLITEHNTTQYTHNSNHIAFDISGADFQYIRDEPDAFVSNEVSMALLSPLFLGQNNGRSSMRYSLIHNWDREVYDRWYQKALDTGSTQGDFGLFAAVGQWYGRLTLGGNADYYQSITVPNSTDIEQGYRLNYSVPRSVIANDTNDILTFMLWSETTSVFGTPGSHVVEHWNDIQMSLLYDADTHTYIHKWEYIDAGQTQLGKQRSNRLTNAGRGPTAEPGANLAGLDLRQAFMENANLQGADLTDANLTQAYARGIDLSGALLTGALVDGADFSESVGLTASAFYSTTSYRTNSFGAINLSSNDLRGWDFAGKALDSASFESADMSAANLSVARFWRTNFSGATMVGANLANARFGDSTLRASLFVNANLSGADLRGAELGYADLTEANLTDAVIDDTQFGDLSGFNSASGLTSAQVYSTANYKNKNLSGVAFAGIDMTGWDFPGHNLSDTLFRRTTLDATNFAGAETDSTSFDRATAFNANFSGIAGTSTRFDYAIINGSQFDNANLMHPSFFRAELTNTSFVGAVLDFSDFSFATLNNVDFTGASFSGSSSNFRDAVVTNSSFDDTVFTDSFLGAGDFTGSTFKRANLGGANLDGATLSGVDLEDAIINGSFMRSIIGFTESQLRSTESYKSGVLERISFDVESMSEWDFRGLELRDVRFLSTDLSNAQFDGAVVDGDFRGNLSGASFVGATLVGSSFSISSDVTGADFSEAVIHGGFSMSPSMTFEQLASTRSYQLKKLNDVSFFILDLSGMDLSGFDFRGARMEAVDISGANLTNARLSEAEIYSSSLSQAASLYGVDLRLSRTISVDELETIAALDANIVVPNVAANGRITGFAGEMLTGLKIAAAEKLLISDIYRFEEYPIAVHEEFTVEAEGTLVYSLYDSEPGTQLDTSLLSEVSLAGTFILDSQDTFEFMGSELELKLFEWGDATVVGEFQAIRLGQGLSDYLTYGTATGEHSPLASLTQTSAPGWVIDDSRLYTDGVLVLLAVPEPSSIVLCAIVALAIGGRRRKAGPAIPT